MLSPHRPDARPRPLAQRDHRRPRARPRLVRPARDRRGRGRPPVRRPCSRRTQRTIKVVVKSAGRAERRAPAPGPPPRYRLTIRALGPAGATAPRCPHRRPPSRRRGGQALDVALAASPAPARRDRRRAPPPRRLGRAVLDRRRPRRGCEPTLFEGPVTSAGNPVRAASDAQQRHCDGTNLSAHPSPGATATGTAVDGLRTAGLDFDAKWFPGYDDYYSCASAPTPRTSARPTRPGASSRRHFTTPAAARPKPTTAIASCGPTTRSRARVPQARGHRRPAPRRPSSPASR